MNYPSPYKVRVVTQKIQFQQQTLNITISNTSNTIIQQSKSTHNKTKITYHGSTKLTSSSGSIMRALFSSYVLSLINIF